MTTITLTADDDGKLVGLTDKDRRAWARFKKRAKELVAGEIMELETHFARNPKFHRLHFAMLGNVFAGQEFFGDFDDFRKWATVGAGFATYVTGKDGNVIAIPASLKYRALDDEQFADVHQRTKAFLRSEYARKTLWPHLTSDATWGMIETYLQEA